MESLYKPLTLPRAPYKASQQVKNALLVSWMELLKYDTICWSLRPLRPPTIHETSFMCIIKWQPHLAVVAELHSSESKGVIVAIPSYLNSAVSYVAGAFVCIEIISTSANPNILSPPLANSKLIWYYKSRRAIEFSTRLLRSNIESSMLHTCCLPAIDSLYKRITAKYRGISSVVDSRIDAAISREQRVETDRRAERMPE